MLDLRTIVVMLLISAVLMTLTLAFGLRASTKGRGTPRSAIKAMSGTGWQTRQR